MSEADEAYAYAEQLIEEAIGLGARELDLNSVLHEEKTKALERIPESVSRIKTITMLDLRYTDVSDLHPISALTALKVLDLGMTQVSDLRPINALKALQSLDLFNTQVSDLQPISNLSALELLLLQRTQVSDLLPIGSLTALRGLFLDHTRVRDLRPISTLISLDALFLNNTLVSDLSPLLNIPRLRDESHTKKFIGVRFQNSQATRDDPELRRISEIDDNWDRTQELLDYLEAKQSKPPPNQTTKDEANSSAPPEDATVVLTAETLVEAQDDAGWRFSPTQGVLELFVRDTPLEERQATLAGIVADRIANLKNAIGARTNAGGIREEVANEADRFDQILSDNGRSMSLRSLELWSSLIALGNLLDANDTGRVEGRDPLDLLSVEGRAALQTFLSIAASLVRSFPEARALDEDLSGFTQGGVPITLILALLEKALSSNLIDGKSAALIQHVSAQAEGDGVQNQKAERVTEKGAKNLVLVSALSAGLGAAGGAVVTDVFTDLSNHYELGESAIELSDSALTFVKSASNEISEFINGLSPDEKALLRAALIDAQTPKSGPR